MKSMRPARSLVLSVMDGRSAPDTIRSAQRWIDAPHRAAPFCIHCLVQGYHGNLLAFDRNDGNSALLTAPLQILERDALHKAESCTFILGKLRTSCSRR